MATVGIKTGFTTTLTGCCVGVPPQASGLIVKKYVTVIGAAVVFISVSLIDAELALAAGLLMPATATRVQAKVNVPAAPVVAV